MKLTLTMKVLGTTVLSAIVTGVVGFTIHANVTQMSEAQKWVSHTDAVIARFHKLVSLMVDMETGERGFLMSGDEKFLEPYNTATKEFDAFLKETQAIVSDNPTQVKRLDKVLELKNSWLTEASHEMEDRKKYDARQIPEAQLLASLREAHGKVIMDQLRKEIAEGISMEASLNEVRKAKNLDTATLTKSWVVYGLAGAVLLSVILLSLITQAVSRVMRKVESVVGPLASGSQELKSASAQISASAQQLSGSTTEAASSLEETVSSIEELSSMVSQNAQSSKEANAISQSSRKAAEDGEVEINELIHAMNEIASSSKKIEDIINVIDDIAFQTNLLALNAAVEAARAGEQGKGFAVVAEAVRNLAQRSASAAKDIASLIKESAEKSERGLTLAGNSGKALNSIVTQVKKVSDLVAEISTASNEQATGLQQVSKALNQLDEVTQSNASGAEECSAASESLESQADEVENMAKELASVVGLQDKTEKFRSPAPAQAGRSTQRLPKSVSNHSSSPQKSRRALAENAIPFENEEGSESKIGSVSGF